MSETELRNSLFKKYFEVEDGVLVTSLVNNLSFISELWKKLHILCEENIEYFDSYSSFDGLKFVAHKGKNYLIIKLRMFRYIIIDVDNNENISEDFFRNEFDEEFFITNFKERKLNYKDGFNRLYDLDTYKGDIQELINLCIEGQDIFNLTPTLNYRVGDEKAYSYFFIDFVNVSAQVGFQTPDQFLYEQLFLKYDLSPSKMQDAQSRIGVDRMKEMFSEIKKIKIPVKEIPNDLYNKYLEKDNEKMLILKKK